MERIDGTTLKVKLRALYTPMAATPYGETGMALARAVGSAVARMHNAEVVHGDLTTSNLMLREASALVADGAAVSAKGVACKGADIVVIDFGLSYTTSLHEDKAVDMYERSCCSIFEIVRLMDLSRGSGADLLRLCWLDSPRRRGRYVLERAFVSTHANSQALVDEVPC
jgi:tRNA A-37 threonylcarbamoyl transferase component Bud32